jgi:NAD(P)H-hydrate epimerase
VPDQSASEALPARLSDGLALLDAREMAEADRLTITGGISSIELMGNAGLGVAMVILARFALQPVVVLCGPGSNGGDGLVVAGQLAAAGWPVRVALWGERAALRGAAAHYAELWQGPVEVLRPGVLDGVELVVDALFGAGLSRALEGASLEVLGAAAVRRLTIVAVDIPSGVMGDTGADLGAAPAQITVTCFRKKPGHLLEPGRSLCGELIVTDIGTPLSVFDSIYPKTFENGPALWEESLPRRRADGNKYTCGHALVWGGYPTTGAARMAARAAARAGAGLTTVAVPVAALAVYAGALTSIMVTPIATPGELEHLLSDRPGRGRRACDAHFGQGHACDPSTVRARRRRPDHLQGRSRGAVSRHHRAVRHDAARGRIRAAFFGARRQADAGACRRAAERGGADPKGPRHRHRRARRPGARQFQRTGDARDRGIG